MYVARQTQASTRRVHSSFRPHPCVLVHKSVRLSVVCLLFVFFLSFDFIVFIGFSFFVFCVCAAAPVNPLFESSFLCICISCVDV